MYRCDKCFNEYSKFLDPCPMCGGKLKEYVAPEIPKSNDQIMAERSVREYRLRVESALESELQRVQSELTAGRTLYLYRSFYVSIDSSVDFGGKQHELNPYSDAAVLQAGLYGWKVVGVMPRTSGNALQNYEGFSKAWAGGIGGNMVGSYVLMELPVTKDNFEYTKPYIIENIKACVS